MAYVIWVHKSATPENWFMQVKGLTFVVVLLYSLDRMQNLLKFVSMRILIAFQAIACHVNPMIRMLKN